MRAMLRWLAVILTVLLATACSRGPDEAGLAADVQARLDELFGRQVLVLRHLKRQGSAPFAAAADGAGQAIVYFNATLELAESYDPSNWESLSPQLIADALGATDQGLVGLGSGSMAPGTELRAYGSLVYRRQGEAWQPAALPPRAAQRTTAGRAPRSQTDELVARLAQIVDKSPGLHGSRDAIVAEELDRALQNIELRLDTDRTEVIVATGPAGGEYARFVESLTARLGTASTIRVANTEGSVSNAFLVDRGKARFGLVQSDVAAAAVGGSGLFATTGPLQRLRAVASLFPEQLHVVVRADSGIGSIAELAGRRIALGDTGSGTRHTALQVLAAHGLEPGTYTESFVQGGPGESMEQLAAGTLDAVVAVVSAPWRQLAQVASRLPLRILPLDPAAMDRVLTDVPGLVLLAIPARTYPGQEGTVPSLAATALLVTDADTPDPVVIAALESIFAATAVPGRGVAASRLSRARALDGVTIPLHPGAAAYFRPHPPGEQPRG